MKLKKVKQFLDGLNCSDIARKYAILSLCWRYHSKHCFDLHNGNILYSDVVNRKDVKYLVKTSVVEKPLEVYQLLANSVIDFEMCCHNIVNLSSDLNEFRRRCCYKSSDAEQLTMDILFDCYDTGFSYKDVIDGVVTSFGLRCYQFIK